MQIKIAGFTHDVQHVYPARQVTETLDKCIELNSEEKYGIGDSFIWVTESMYMGDRGLATYFSDIVEWCLEDSCRNELEAFLIRPTKDTCVQLLAKAHDEGVIDADTYLDLQDHYLANLDDHVVVLL